MKYSPKSFGNFDKSRRKVNVIDLSLEKTSQDRVAIEEFYKDEHAFMGAGLSYGPIGISQTDNGTFSLKEKIDYSTHINVENLQVEVDARMSVGNLEKMLLQSGYTLKVVPGAENASIGGCVASDVHGKNGHIFGSFGDHINSINILSQGNSYVEQILPSDELFSMTVGGFGVTGLIVSVNISIEKARGISMEVLSTRYKSSKLFVEELVSTSTRVDDIGGWFCYNQGLFRGKIFTANWSPRIPTKNGHLPFLITIPIFWIMGVGPWRSFFISILNKYIFLQNERGTPAKPETVLFPLSGLSGWQMVYGGSFIERQFLVSFSDSHRVINDICKMIDKYSVQSLLNGIKVFKGKRSGDMSFANEGLGFSIQYSGCNIDFDDELTQYLVSIKSPEYIAKMQALTTTFPIGYPMYNKWFELAKSNNVKSILFDWLYKNCKR